MARHLGYCSFAPGPSHASVRVAGFPQVRFVYVHAARRNPHPPTLAWICYRAFLCAFLLSREPVTFHLAWHMLVHTRAELGAGAAGVRRSTAG